MNVNVFRIKQTTLSWIIFDNGLRGDVNELSDEWDIITDMSYKQIQSKYSHIVTDVSATYYYIGQVESLNDVDDANVEILTQEDVC